MATFPLTLPINVRDINATKELEKIRGSMDRLTKHTTKLSGAFQNAFQFYVRFRIFGLINRAISSIEGAIPALIARGREWGQVVDDVADSTGMAAEQASLFAGAAQVMTGNVDGLTRALGAVAQQVVNHHDVLKRYGIATKNANGELLDSWTILQNIRKALSDTGNSFITTAAARDLFSRGGQTLLDLLTMTDRQFRMLARDVAASGAVMSKQGLAIADQFERTMRRLELQVTGVANAFMEAIGPNLMRFVDSITEFIRANLAEIVKFLAQVTSAVIHFTAGFLGLDLVRKAFPERMDEEGKKSDDLESRLNRNWRSRQEQTKTENRHTDAIKGQIEAIDRQIEALDRQERAEDARKRHRELMQDIADAQRELNELRAKSIFAAGMTNLEAELARQAQAAEIMEAEKRIAEARQAMREEERRQQREDRRYALEQRKAALQEQLAAQMKALSDSNNALREAGAQIFGDGKGGLFSNANIKKVREAALAGWQEMKPGFTQAGRNFRQALSGAGDVLLQAIASLQVEVPRWLAWAQSIGILLQQVLQTIENLLARLGEALPGWMKDSMPQLSPAEWVATGIGAFATRGLWMPIVKKLGGIGLGALGGAGGAAAPLVATLSRAIAPLALLWSGKEIIDAVNNNSKMFEEAKLGNFDKLNEFLETASSAQIRQAITNLRELPEQLPPLQNIIYNASSGIVGLDVLFGNVKEHNETIIGMLEKALVERQVAPLRVPDAGIIDNTGGSGGSAGGSGGGGRQRSGLDEFVGAQSRRLNVKTGLDESMANIERGIGSTGSATGHLTSLVLRAKQSYMQDSLLDRAGVVSTYLRDIATSTKAMSQGGIWGVANMNVYLDRDLVLQLAGVPIRPNTSLRAQKAT